MTRIEQLEQRIADLEARQTKIEAMHRTNLAIAELIAMFVIARGGASGEALAAAMELTGGLMDLVARVQAGEKLEPAVPRLRLVTHGDEREGAG